MKRLTLVMLSLIPPIAAETAVWIDLSGAWVAVMADGRRTELRLPLGRRLDPDLREISRTVYLPQEARGAPLAWTIGGVSRSFEAYADGQLIGTTGPEGLEHLQIARPRIFDVPSVNRPEITLRLRLRPPFGISRGSAGWEPADSGPWLLTSPIAAPRDAEAFVFARQRLLRVGDLTQPIVLLTLAVVVGLVFARDPRRSALLWLAMLLITVAAARLWIYMEIREDATPWAAARWLELLRWQLGIGLFAHLACAVAGAPRWILWPVWILAMGATLPEGATTRAAISWAPRLLILTGIIIGYVRAKPRRHWLTFFLFLTVCLQGVSQLNMLANNSPLLRRLDEAFLFGFRFAPFVMLLCIMSFVLTIALVRELLKDRDDKLRLEADLEAARTVQLILIPPAQPAAGNLASDAVYLPAQEVGGDLYLVDHLGTGGVLAVVGDVSGKGLKAAMFVALVVGALRNRHSNAPAAVLGELNRVLHGRMDGGFATCVVALVDGDGNGLIAGAGHPPPYRNGAELAHDQGLPLGLALDVIYSETRFQLAAGDRLTMVSDGVVEAANAKGELFGFDRTREISAKSAQEIAAAAKAWGQNDDITVVTVGRNG